MKTLVVKLGAAGDVLRTTPLLSVLPGDIFWITSRENLILLADNQRLARSVAWEEASNLTSFEYDLVINLEDSREVSEFVRCLRFNDLFGAHLSESNVVTYTDSSREWFDLSLISRFGSKEADQLKLRNRKSYQDMLFRGLGYEFRDDNYYLPKSVESDLVGDIAIADRAGSVWPMKNWAYYGDLKVMLEGYGYKVNVLPQRRTILQHIADVQNHQCLVSGDSLPMHIALGNRINCVSIFQCTSPWEIHGYGVQTQIVSPQIEKYFYKRNFEAEATRSITVAHVYDATVRSLAALRS